LPTLNDYRESVRKLAKEKGYNQELFYLHGRMIQEGCELLDAIWQKKTPDEIGEEGADLLHFFLQMMDLVPEIDIDKSLIRKIESNYAHKKKTMVHGEMVKK